MGRKITELKVQKRNPNRVNVYLDGEFAFGLTRIVAAWLAVGQELSDEKINRLQTEDAREAAYQQAINFISARERTEAEVRRKLVERGVEDGIIPEVLERLQRSGLLNDSRFAHTWVENRSEFRPRSRRALAYELRQKGLPDEAIRAAVASVEDEDLAYQAAMKYAPRLRQLDWPEFRQKLYAFLARRGFSFDTCRSVAARVWSDIGAGELNQEHSNDIEVDQ
jgi:regulatory protein